MNSYRVFLRGEPRTDRVLAALQVVHPFTALDGPIGSADLVGVRSALLVELREDHEEDDWHGHETERYPLLVRFGAAGRAQAAWVAAHAFLWRITRRGDVDEALLTGPDTRTLRYRRGRILPAQALRQPHSDE